MPSCPRCDAYVDSRNISKHKGGKACTARQARALCAKQHKYPIAARYRRALIECVVPFTVGIAERISGGANSSACGTDKEVLYVDAWVAILAERMEQRYNARKFSVFDQSDLKPTAQRFRSIIRRARDSQVGDAIQTTYMINGWESAFEFPGEEDL
jgi:hypothetical protein